MMYTQGLKRLMVARGAAVQLLVGSSRASASLINQNLQAFSVYNIEQVLNEFALNKLTLI